MYNKPLIFIDTETSGLNYRVNGIISLAYIIEVDKRVVRRGKITMNPLSYPRETNKVSPQALEVNGYKEHHLVDFPDAKEQCTNFVSIINSYVDRFDKESYLVPVGFNTKFDTDFIQSWFKVCGYETYGQYFSHKSLDCFELVKLLVYLGKLDTGKSQSLTSCCRAIGIEFDAHDSSLDIETTRDLFYRLIERYM